MTHEKIKEKLIFLTSDNIESTHYNLLVLINFFIENENNLSDNDKKIIATKCEKHRLNINNKVSKSDKIGKHEIKCNIYKYYKK